MTVSIPASAQVRGLHALSAVALVGTAAILANLVTLPNIPTWYAGLAKPSFNPPNWLFGPVWGVLYAMMAVAFWRVLGTPPERTGRLAAILAFVAQMALNALWSVAFFGLHSPALGLFVIILLEGLILLTIVLFGRLDPVAAWLLVPYAAWVAFATVLNAALWSLNG
jgi:tryptophan-rich sensory protein